MGNQRGRQLARTVGGVVAVVGGVTLSFLFFAGWLLLSAFNPTPREQEAARLLAWAMTCGLGATVLAGVGAWGFTRDRYRLLPGAAVAFVAAAALGFLAWRVYPRMAPWPFMLPPVLMALAVPWWGRR